MADDSEDSAYPSCAFANWCIQQLRRFASEGRVAQIFGDDGGSSWTFEELLQNTVHVAAGLGSFGISPGDRVSFVTRNSHELFAVVLGCVFNGVIVVPSVAESPPAELRQHFVLIKPKFVISGENFVAKVNEAINGAESDFKPNLKPRILELKQLFKDAVAQGCHTDPYTYEPVRTVDPKRQVVCSIFTSGTTGKQKAASLTGHGFLRSLYACRFSNLTSDPAFNPSQISWVSWWFILMRGLLMGWTRIFVDSTNPDNVLSVAQKHAAKSLNSTPFVLAGLVKRMEENPGRWDLSLVKNIFIGGDMMSKSTHERFAKMFCNAKIYQVYGTTEVGMVIQSRTDLPIVYGSIGQPLSPIKLVDMESGQEVTDPNIPGEVVVKWCIMQEYIDNPEETANAFDENGWFKSGDAAVFDESGNYFIVDRIKEMFKHHGIQVCPNELEDIIKKLPGVREVVVVGKASSLEIGHLPTAFVVKEQGCDITEQDIHDGLAKEKLHDAKRLHGGVIFTTEIPKNSIGKPVRAKLKESLNQSQPSDH